MPKAKHPLPTAQGLDTCRTFNVIAANPTDQIAEQIQVLLHYALRPEGVTLTGIKKNVFGEKATRARKLLPDLQTKTLAWAEKQKYIVRYKRTKRSRFWREHGAKHSNATQEVYRTCLTRLFIDGVRYLPDVKDDKGKRLNLLVIVNKGLSYEEGGYKYMELQGFVGDLEKRFRAGDKGLGKRTFLPAIERAVLFIDLLRYAEGAGINVDTKLTRAGCSPALMRAGSTEAAEWLAYMLRVFALGAKASPYGGLVNKQNFDSIFGKMSEQVRGIKPLNTSQAQQKAKLKRSYKKQKKRRAKGGIVR